MHSSSSSQKFVYVPLSEDGRLFQAVICTSNTQGVPVRGREFEVTVEFQTDSHNSAETYGSPGLYESAVLQTDSTLQELLRGKETLLRNYLANCTNPEMFFTKLQIAIDKLLMESTDPEIGGEKQSYSVPKLPSSTLYYTLVLAQIQQLGWDSVTAVSDDMTQITAVVTDTCNREHTVSLILDTQFPTTPPTVELALPVMSMVTDLTKDWRNMNQQNKGLYNVVQQAKKAIQTFRQFFDVMDELDEKCDIVEPTVLSRIDTYRRIHVGQHSTLSVIVNPLSPYSLPHMTFSGMDRIIKPLQDKLGQNAVTWDVNSSVHNNLQRILQLDQGFPKRAKHTETDDQCGICYQLRLEGQLPNKACDNCATPYHKTCLIEWLKSSSCKENFGSLFGHCVYCSNNITVKLK
eukprot:TRINITY_DN66793_c2_g1_i1.p1 TRINITY_DN66793_c2_g1~~TRINITY_DN66793_c2_g1_i1.p1  ORF type:complete len:405 (+),score=25.02 TRINITY_DN66793_c2_g1_i1:44-1258(+)